MLQEVAREAETTFTSLGPFSTADVAGLIGLAFLGGETLILLGDPQWSQQIQGWLRSVGVLIRQVEEA